MNPADSLTIIGLAVVGFIFMAICHTQSKRIDELSNENLGLHNRLVLELERSLSQASEHEKRLVELLKKLEETK